MTKCIKEKTGLQKLKNQIAWIAVCNRILSLLLIQYVLFFLGASVPARLCIRLSLGFLWFYSSASVIHDYDHLRGF